MTRFAIAAVLTVPVVMCAMGCGLAGKDECGGDYWGGGDFTIALSGDIKGTATGAGLSKAALENWILTAPTGWHETTQMYIDTGLTGGIYAEEEFQDVFAGSVEVPVGTFSGPSDGQVTGFEVVNFVSASARGGELHVQFGIIAAGMFEHVYMQDMSADVREFAVEGAAHAPPDKALTFGPSPGGGPCPSDTPCPEVTLSWHLDPAVSFAQRYECDDPYNPFD